MDTDLWINLLITALLISISPGAGALNTINQSLNYGFKKSLVSIIGLQIGWGLQIILVSIGIGALVVASPTTFNIIKWCGVLYLIYLGIQQILTKADVMDINYKQTQQTFRPTRALLQACIINTLNLKGTLFLVVFIPVFIKAQQPFLPQLTIVLITLLFADIVVMCGYAYLAAKIRLWFTTPEKTIWLNRIIGITLIIVGISLSYTVA